MTRDIFNSDDHRTHAAKVGSGRPTSNYGPVVADTRPAIAEYTPAPVIDREATLARVIEAERRAAMLMEIALPIASDSVHVRVVLVTGNVNNVAASLRTLLRDGADDREFEAPLARLTELEVGLTALDV